MGVVIQTYVGVETESRVSSETYVRVLEALLKGGYARLPAAVITGPVVREGGVAYALPPSEPAEGVSVAYCDDTAALVAAVVRAYETSDIVVRFARTGPKLLPDWVEDDEDAEGCFHGERGIGLFSLREPRELVAFNAYGEGDEDSEEMDAGVATLYLELEGKDAPMADDVRSGGLPKRLKTLTGGKVRVAGGAW